MMIKFSWKRINNKFGWNAVKVLQYFYLIQKVDSIFLKIYRPENLVKKEAEKGYYRGPCFILNIDKALKWASSSNDLYIYLELASKRNIFDYKARGIVYLPIALIPEYLMGLVETNPMLEIKEDKLYFKYEQE